MARGIAVRRNGVDERLLGLSGRRSTASIRGSAVLACVGGRDSIDEGFFIPNGKGGRIRIIRITGACRDVGGNRGVRAQNTRVEVFMRRLFPLYDGFDFVFDISEKIFVQISHGLRHLKLFIAGGCRL